MKKTFFLLVVLLATAPLWAADAVKPVVVDPLDFRKPIPEPEGALTEKYDGKLVRFTGAARRATVDKNTKLVRFELIHELLGPAAKGKKTEVKETIIVAVTFQGPQRDLQAAAGRKAAAVTVEGKGAVMADGSLVITEAVIVLEKKR